MSMSVCFQKQNCQGFHISISLLIFVIHLCLKYSNVLIYYHEHIENSNWLGFNTLHDEIPNDNPDVSCKKIQNFEEASGNHLCSKLTLYGQISVIFLFS